jgi:hypothetical protein
MANFRQNHTKNNCAFNFFKLHVLGYLEKLTKFEPSKCISLEDIQFEIFLNLLETI